MRKLDPVRHEQRRREILAAAGRCFARDGFRGASISDICAEAGSFGALPFAASSGAAAPQEFITDIYTVVFAAEGREDVSAQVVHGDTAPAQPPPSIVGKVFIGWVYGNQDEPFTFDMPITSDLTVTAVFAESKHNVRFLSGNPADNSGASVLRSLDVAGGAFIDAAGIIVPDADGKYFTGTWLYDAAGDGALVPYDFSVSVIADLTLIPQFSEGYRVWFVSGATFIEPQSVAAGSNAIMPATPVRA